MTQGIGAYPSSKTESVKLELLCSCESYGIIHGPESYGIIHGPESYGIIHGPTSMVRHRLALFLILHGGLLSLSRHGVDQASPDHASCEAEGGSLRSSARQEWRPRSQTRAHGQLGAKSAPRRQVAHVW